MRFYGILIAAGLMLSAPVRADVAARGEQSFVIRYAAEVSASPGESWKQLTTPSGWWTSQHTWTGDAANLTLQPRAGGCFCEAVPAPADQPKAAPLGSVEHARVINAVRDKALRLSGALGPLQSEAVIGTLTFTLTPVDAGTRVLMEYVVGGYMRYKTEQLAPLVDKVMGEQFASLTGKLGPRVAAGDAVVPPPVTANDPATAQPASPGEPLGPPAPEGGR